MGASSDYIADLPSAFPVNPRRLTPPARGKSCTFPLGTDFLHVDLNGHITLVWHQPVPYAMWAIPSPDGRHLALSRASMVSNGWMIEGF